MLRRQKTSQLKTFKLSSPSSARYINEYLNFAEIKHLVDELAVKLETKKLKTITLLSEFAGEGKSFFSLTLAAAYGKFYNKKVLVLDTSHQKDTFAYFVKGADDFKDTIIKKSVFKNVDLAHVYDFPNTSSDMIDYQLDGILQELYNQYDLIVIDTNAYAIANRHNIHPLVVARRTDGSILLTSGVSSYMFHQKRYQNDLNQSHVKLIGVIYNEGLDHER